MKMTCQPLAAFVAFVFMLMASAPAFSAVQCGPDMMRGVATTGSSHHLGHQSALAGQQVSAPCLHQTEKIQVDCDSFCQCMPAPSKTANMRVDDVKLMVLTKKSPVGPMFDVSPGTAMEMFDHFLIQQGPPLRLKAAYKAYLAKTNRQLI